jgi:hypothetical protein
VSGNMFVGVPNSARHRIAIGFTLGGAARLVTFNEPAVPAQSLLDIDTSESIELQGSNLPVIC